MDLLFVPTNRDISVVMLNIVFSSVLSIFYSFCSKNVLHHKSESTLIRLLNNFSGHLRAWEYSLNIFIYFCIYIRWCLTLNITTTFRIAKYFGNNFCSDVFASCFLFLYMVLLLTQIRITSTTHKYNACVEIQARWNKIISKV